MIWKKPESIPTLVKLVRVAMLVPAVMVFMWLFRASRKEESGAAKVPMLPGFLVGFVLLVVINSLGPIPDVVNEGMSNVVPLVSGDGYCGSGYQNLFPEAFRCGRSLVINGLWKRCYDQPLCLARWFCRFRGSAASIIQMIILGDPT